MELGTIGDVVVNAHGKQVGLLPHHADLAAQLGHIHILAVHILAAEKQVALDLYAGHQILHPVHCF